MADPIVFVFVAKTRSDERVLAIAPLDVDPLTKGGDKLCWHTLSPDQDHNELLDSLGYRSTGIKPHPDYWNILGTKRIRLRFGKTKAKAGAVLIGAAVGAEIAGLIPEDTPKSELSKRANTFRIYARRGHGPKPYDTRRRPLWIEQEVKWWAANRTGQGSRTDKTQPVIVGNDN